MKLLLMRHGVAEDPIGYAPTHDFDRVLTKKGRKRIRRLGRALRDIAVVPELIVSSPLVRAVQTAEVLVAALDSDQPVLVRRELAVGGDIYPVSQELAAMGVESALLVGHEPTLSIFAADRTNSDKWGGSFSKGMILALQIDEGNNAKALFSINTEQFEPIFL